MFATLMALGLTHFAVQCDEISAEVRLLSSTKYNRGRKDCDQLISRSPKLWKNGGFRTCHAGSSIETEEGGTITPFTITVNMTKIKNFAGNGTNGDKYTFINRKLNLNAQSCATVTGPNLEKTLGGFPVSYSVEINVHTTSANQEDLSRTIVIGNIRNASSLLRPIDCKHKATHSEISQSYHHQYEVNLQMSDTNDRPATEAVLLQLFWIQRMLEFARSNCTPISLPAYDTKSKMWTALVSGPSHLDVCQMAKNQEQYSGHLCEEAHKVNITSAVKSQRIFRMRLKEQIYLSDIKGYMNEHSKFVNYLNSRSSTCKFNGSIQLDESDLIPGVPCHTSRPHFN